jgi:hypothetical protein
MTRTLLIPVLLVASITPSAAWASIILGPMNRHVFAQRTGSSIVISRSTDGLFNESVSVSVPLGDTIEPSQTSDIDPLALTGLPLTGVGDVRVTDSFDPDADILAESFFDVIFDLAAPHTFSLSGELRSEAEGGSPDVRFSLVGPSINFSRTIGANDIEEFMDSGTLGPGQYRLVASAKMTPGAGNGQFWFDLRLASQIEAVPEPASLAVWGLAAISAAAGLVRRQCRAGQVSASRY